MTTTTPLCRFRVLYLGSEVPTRSKDGLQGIQEPLEHLYPEIGAPDLAGVDAFLSVWSNGVLVEPVVVRNGLSTKRFYHIDSLHYCAAVRYSEYGAMESSSREIGLLRFLPLDTLQARDSATHHPPLFALTMRRASGVKLLECKVFVCKSDEAANELVRACFRAYSDTAFANVLEHAHPPQQIQPPQQTILPLAANPGMPIVSHGYAGSALMTPGNRSLLISRASNNSGSVEQLNGMYSDSGSRTDTKPKKKKRSPFWPFAKPAGERSRRSRSLNTPRPPSAAKQQQMQPVLLAPPEYGSLVYYLPTDQVQKGTSLMRYSSADSQSSRNLIVNPQQPLHILYATPSPQQQHAQWTSTSAATPVYLSSGGGYIPTTSTSFVSNDYAAYYEQPPSVPYYTAAQQQPWNTNVGNYDDLVYYDPYNNQATSAVNGYIPPKQAQTTTVNLRKTKSMAVRQEVPVVAETHNGRRPATSPHHHRRHRVRSGDFISGSKFAEPSMNSAAKPPIMLKTSLYHPDGTLPASSSKSTSVSSSTTSSLSSSTPGSKNKLIQRKQPAAPQYKLSGDRSHAHTKSMVIPEDQTDEIEEIQESDDYNSTNIQPPLSQSHHPTSTIKNVNRNVVRPETLHAKDSYETSRELRNADQSSTSSAFSSASGGNGADHQHRNDEPNSASSVEGSGRHLSPPPLPPPSPMSPSLLLSNSKNVGQQRASEFYDSDSSLRHSQQPPVPNHAKYVKFDDPKNHADEITTLVDELRIEHGSNKANRDHTHWQQVTTKTKVKRGGNVSVSPVDSGQHEPTSLDGVNHHELSSGKWQRRSMHSSSKDDLHTAGTTIPRSSGDRPYIPEVDYDI